MLLTAPVGMALPLAGYIARKTGREEADMAEDRTAEEERQDAEEEETDAQEEESEETQSSAEGSEDSDEEAPDPTDERGEAGGKIGDVKIDEVDPSEPTQEDDVAAAQMRKLEKEGPPEALGDWPRGKAMYLTFGGSEGGEGYEDGSPRQMGPSSLRHYPDGSVEVQGEMVDNPEDYKAEQTVTEEAEELGMDKGAKSEDDESEDSGESAEGEDSPSAEGDDAASAEGDDSQSQSEEDSEEPERAEAG
jgi:hypothetical protein